MTIKKLAIGIAMAILLTATNAQAKVHQWGSSFASSPVQQFCGDRYCGHIEAKQSYKSARIKSQPRSHKGKRAKHIRVASIDNNSSVGFSGGLAAQAAQYSGMTAGDLGLRRTAWCSAFIRMLTNASNVDDRAISWLNKPRTSGGIGSIAVMRHHVGIVSGYDGNGNPILISGNHRHRVGIGAYPKHRIIAYVTP